IFLCGIAVFIFCLCGCFCSFSSSFAYAQDEFVSAFNAESQSSGENYTYEICDTSFSNDGTQESTFLCVESGDNVLVSNCVFDGATSAAIVVNGGTLTLDGCTVQNSSSTFEFNDAIYNTQVFVKSGTLNLVGGTTISEMEHVSDDVLSYACLVAENGFCNVDDATIEVQSETGICSVANFGELYISSNANLSNSQIFNVGTTMIESVVIQDLITCGDVTFADEILCEKITLLSGYGYEPIINFNGNANDANFIIDWMEIVHVQENEGTGIVTFKVEQSDTPSILDKVVGASANDMSLLAEKLNENNPYEKYEWVNIDQGTTHNIKLVKYSETLNISYFNQSDASTQNQTYEVYPRHEDCELSVESNDVILGDDIICGYEFESVGQIDIYVDNVLIKSVEDNNSQTLIVSDSNGDRVIDVEIKIKQNMEIEIQTGFFNEDNTPYIETISLMWDYETPIELFIEDPEYTYLCLNYGDEEHRIRIDYNLRFNSMYWGESEVIYLEAYSDIILRTDYVSWAKITLAYDYTEEENTLPEFTYEEFIDNELYTELPEYQPFEQVGVARYPYILFLCNEYAFMIISVSVDAEGYFDLENYDIIYAVYMGGSEVYSDFEGWANAITHPYAFYESPYIGMAEIDFGSATLQIGPAMGNDETLNFMGYNWCYNFLLTFYGEYEGEQEYGFYLDASTLTNYDSLRITFYFS
ncbi:MAG: hypothetical protein IJW24_04545, partial [Clostridia bacterium]|nr:hypothetical protein [Clostridia bacterium]